MSPKLYCPKRKGGGAVDVLACLYTCPKGIVIQCPEYTKLYPSLSNYVIPEQYVVKYGHKEITVPLKYWKRRKRGVSDAA